MVPPDGVLSASAISTFGPDPADTGLDRAGVVICVAPNLAGCTLGNIKGAQNLGSPGAWSLIVTPVPLPPSLGLLSFGLLGLANLRRKFRQS